jgi:hypothetical protein
MLDREVIESKLLFLKEYLKDLKDYETISLSNYKTNKKDRRFVERTLHLLIFMQDSGMKLFQSF